ncbi:Na+/H+ antiporter NhaC [bacterium]|nr:Na+/H+ antiporter NhaC [bacterium]
MRQRISLFESLLPVGTMLLCFLIGSLILEMGPELLILVMLGAATVAGVLARRRGYGWDEIQRSTGEKLASVLPAILILLTIGMLIGSWVFSGTIPALIYYGLKLVNPQYMVLTAFLVTAVMSLCTGTSWGSAGTIGVALMGMSTAVGAPLAATAGAIVSGAYFGDKLSPLSDSTNICAIGADAYLYNHIRNMLYTAIPSFFIAMTAYAVLGSTTPSDSSQLPPSATLLLNEIDAIYSLNWLTFLPPAAVVAGIILKYPPALTMAGSSILALAIGIGLQGFSLGNALIAAVNGFNISMVAASASGITTFSTHLTTLLNRGGLYSMVNTLLVIVSAFLLAAGMDLSGALDKIIRSMLKRVSSVFGLISATLASGGVMISLTSHGGVTALIIGGLFQKAYQEQNLAPENLSRSLEDSVTIVEPLMPWTVSAIFMATTLGVPTTAYMPWAVFCIGGPVFSFLYAATFARTGFGLKRLTANKQLSPKPDLVQT